MDLENKVYFEWSTTVIIITVTSTLLLLGSAYGIVAKGPGSIWLRAGIGFLFVAPLAYCVLNTPLYLKVDSDKVLLKKVFGHIIIERKDILGAYEIEPRTIANSYRKFGSGGLCGYLGKFNNSKIGDYDMYATQMKNLIFIYTHKKRYIVSCNQPLPFLGSK